MPVTHKPEFAFVIVAAGRGERAGGTSEGPKQYRLVGGKPVIRHALETILTWPKTSNVAIVVHADDHALLHDSLGSLRDDPRLLICDGGRTRQESVLCGLEALQQYQPANVMIHDAARPFLQHDLLERLSDSIASGDRAVIPALQVSDTLKRGEGGTIAQTVDRAALYAAQTPQTFEYNAILDAHRRATKETGISFTDDASIAEWAGIAVRLAEGSPDNVKLTLRRDIEIANERLASKMLPDVRCGNGYDVHQLVPGNGVTLCGVFIEHDKSLSGHSDADVALHALTDALLATCGAGDIGDHFPPTDPQWRGAASSIFLKEAARIVRDKGGVITNADVSLIAEKPKIGPHRQIMRENLADMLGITIDRCSVKATTNEKLGFAGREEGIAAIATATVIFGRTLDG